MDQCEQCGHFGDDDGHFEEGTLEFDHPFTPSDPHRPTDPLKGR